MRFESRERREQIARLHSHPLPVICRGAGSGVVACIHRDRVPAIVIEIVANGVGQALPRGKLELRFSGQRKTPPGRVGPRPVAM